MARRDGTNPALVITTGSPTRRPRLTAAVAGIAVLLAIPIVAIQISRDDGAEVSVFPNYRTVAASADTAITIRGAGASDLDGVEISGSRSGRHQGRWQAHPDGGGATFVPARPFTHGERVTVDAGMRVAGSGEEHSSFVVAPR